MLLPKTNYRSYSTGTLACYDGYFQSENEEAKLSRKALSAVPPLRSPHRRNYTSSHGAPLWLVCKYCHLLLEKENLPAAAGAQRFTSSRPARASQLSIKCALHVVFSFQWSVCTH